MSEFTIRPFGHPGDKDFVVGHLLQKLCWGRYGQGKPRRELVKEWGPFFADMLDRCETRVACDSESPTICYGFLSYQEKEETVLWGAIKKRVERTEQCLATEIAELLIGDLKDKRLGIVFDLPEFRRYKLIPDSWYFTPALLLSLWRQGANE